MGPHDPDSRATDECGGERSPSRSRPGARPALERWAGAIRVFLGTWGRGSESWHSCELQEKGLQTGQVGVRAGMVMSPDMPHAWRRHGDQGLPIRGCHQRKEEGNWPTERNPGSMQLCILSVRSPSLEVMALSAKRSMCTQESPVHWLPSHSLAHQLEQTSHRYGPPNGDASSWHCFRCVPAPKCVNGNKWSL